MRSALPCFVGLLPPQAGTYNLGTSMNVKIQKRKMHLSPNLQRLIGKQCAKVRRILPTFAPHDLNLHVTIEKKPRNQYATALMLTVPQTSICTGKIEANPSTSILRAFHELVGRIKRFKSPLGHEHIRHHRPLQRVENLSTDRLFELETAIKNNIEKLANYIRRELPSVCSGHIGNSFSQAHRLQEESCHGKRRV